MTNSEVLIRKCTPEEIPKVVELWYEVSLSAHDFVSPDFWGSNKTRMASVYLPASYTLVAVRGDELLGFISLVDDQLAALFVRTSIQGRGIGTQLLAEGRKGRRSLSLKVYKKNRKSLAFYLKHGFRVTSEETDPETGEKEFLMTWQVSD